MKYLRMFDNVAERAATLRENDVISIVSFTKSNQVVDIKMPVDLLEAPFWIDNLSDDPNTVTISKSNSSTAESVYIEKSANMKRWVYVEYSGVSGGAKITIAPQSRIYLRFSLNGGKISSLSGYMNEGVGYKISANNIDASKPYAIGGNILSLLNGPLYVPGERLFNSQQIGGSIKDGHQIGTFAELFKGSTTLVDASKLTLPNNLTTYDCYYNMFGGCTSLTSAPALPATTMTSEAYNRMFNGCSSLETLPEISGSEISTRMFYNCIGMSDVTVPNTITTIGTEAFYNALNINYTGSATGSPWGAKSVNGYAEDGFVYTDSTKTTLVACSSAVTSAVIPNTVTTISNNAFNGCTNLTSVTIPSSVTSIGNSAFSGCTKLNTVTVPDTVTTIGSNAFYNVLNITYNGSATGSPWGALSVNGYVDGDLVYTDNTKTTLVGCNKSVTSVVIPNTVTTINKNAFRYCDELTSVTVPASVTSIGENAFSNCPVLVEFECLPTTPPTLSSYGVFNNTPSIIIEVPQGYADTYSSASVWSNSSTRITDGVYGIEYASTNGETVTPHTTSGFNASVLSNTYDTVGFIRFNKAVTTIGSQSFQNCTTLASITIPNTVTSIGNQAFENVKFFSVDVPNTVTSIGTNAFKGTINVNYTGSATGSPWGALTRNSYVEGDLVYTDSTKTTITKCNPSATSVTIPNSVTTISNTAFQSCTGLTSITIPDNVTSIGESAFQSCTGLTSVTIGSGITTISGSAFKNCTGLTSITIPDSVTSIGNQVFMDCSGLTSITLGTGITTIPSYMFANCTGLTSVTIPSGITGIDQYAFSGCSGLTSVTIPNTVTSIGASAFSGSTNLYTVTVPDTVTTIGSSAFTGVTILYYNGSATGSPWGAKCVNGYVEGDFVYTDNTKTELKAYIGTDTTVNIPDTVTTISGRVFKSNTTVITINMPNTLLVIGANVFDGCTNLTLVNLSTNLTSIGEGAFSGCTNLAGNMYIPNGVTSIANYTFSGCSSLTNVTLPNSLTSIGASSFKNCTSLASITLPSTLTSIGQYAFENCRGLSGNITIPNGVTTLPSYTFRECTGIDNIIVPNTVTSIGTEAFKNVANIIYSGSASGSPWGAKSVNGYAEDGFVYTNSTKTEIKKYVGTSTTVTIPNTVTSIGLQAFNKNTTITSVTMSDSVTSIGQKAFNNCSNLESITLSNNITTINSSTFSQSGLTSIVIPEGVTSIDSNAFYECNVLSSVTMQNGLTSIGGSAFEGCDLLQNVTIPASVTSIGSKAFYNISGTLGGASVTCKATTPPTLGSDAFLPTYIMATPTIYVPASVVSTYKSATGWSNYSSNIYAIPE